MVTYKPSEQYFSSPTRNLSIKLFQSLFYSMLRIRRVEEAVEKRYSDNEMKTPIHLAIGQEATSVGACKAMSVTDYLYCGHRTHGNYLAKGGDLKAMLAEFYGRKTGCCGSRGGSMHLLDQKVGMMGSSAICGGIIPIATGSALASQMNKENRVTTVFFGDGAAEEGVLWESLNFAALKNLPILYFCENNFYSVQSPLYKRQPTTSLYRKARSFGIQSNSVDGTNVMSVYKATKNAINFIRQKRGPYFLEAFVYRFRAHGGAGDDSHTGYRDIEELKQWEKLCPIEKFYSFLEEKEILTEDERKVMEYKISLEIEKAFYFARTSPHPTKSDL